MACMTLQSPKSDSQILASGWDIELSKMTQNQQLYAKNFLYINNWVVFTDNRFPSIIRLHH